MMPPAPSRRSGGRSASAVTRTLEPCRQDDRAQAGEDQRERVPELQVPDARAVQQHDDAERGDREPGDEREAIAAPLHGQAGSAGRLPKPLSSQSRPKPRRTCSAPTPMSASTCSCEAPASGALSLAKATSTPSLTRLSTDAAPAPISTSDDTQASSGTRTTAPPTPTSSLRSVRPGGRSTSRRSTTSSPMPRRYPDFTSCSVAGR